MLLLEGGIIFEKCESEGEVIEAVALFATEAAGITTDWDKIELCKKFGFCNEVCALCNGGGKLGNFVCFIGLIAELTDGRWNNEDVWLLIDDDAPDILGTGDVCVDTGLL